MKIFYLRDKKRQPVACVAWEYDGKKIRFALSTYNPIEKCRHCGKSYPALYNQEFGRSLAIGRFHFAPHTIETAVPVVGIQTILGIIVHDGHAFPTRARRAAELWSPKTKSKKNKAA